MSHARRNKPNNINTRGHHHRLFKRHVHYDLRKYYFGNRSLLYPFGIVCLIMLLKLALIGIFEKRNKSVNVTTFIRLKFVESKHSIHDKFVQLFQICF